MKFYETKLKGCFILKPEIYEDDRGLFLESYNQKEMEKCIGQKFNFVQENLSISKYGVVRGLHFQKSPFAQSKLVYVTKGKVQDVVVDLREDSDSYLNHISVELSEAEHKYLFIPKGMAHGFAVLANDTEFRYKVDCFYKKSSEGGFHYNSPKFKIQWKLHPNDVILSDKDKLLPKA